MSICSISSGFNPEIALPNKFTKSRSLISCGSISTGSFTTTPSTTQSGSCEPNTVEVPRILKRGAAPICPVFCIKIIPGTYPSNIWSIVCKPGVMISSALIVVIALAFLRASTLVYPVLITTSSNSATVSRITTLIVSLPVYLISWVSIPINEYTRIMPLSDSTKRME